MKRKQKESFKYDTMTYGIHLFEFLFFIHTKHM